ncbi:MAG: hypothetical protein SOR64_06165, partial [Eubacteriales bacterium]|nr:hypothetical protein [Eubacteriales bacterium]
STSFKFKNNNHTKATKYMSFSELLFTFQPFPRPRFRMIVCPIIPFALPRATRMLTRPIAHTFAQSVALMLATLIFPPT